MNYECAWDIIIRRVIEIKEENRNCCSKDIYNGEINKKREKINIWSMIGN